MSRTEFIELSFPNGEKWRIKAYPIAVERAYAMVELPEQHPDYDNALNDEIEYVLCPEGFDDLLYYLENQMEWDKLDKELIKVIPMKPTYSEWLLAGDYYPKPVLSHD
jgi:hypothetical protein